jgi:ADP-ribose pyrophosphatase
MVEISSRRTVFATDWFSLEERQLSSGGEPYFALKCPDFISIVALTANDELVLVRQYRPAVEEYTLELPSGHVDLGETPLAAAARELTEETGYVGSTIEEMAIIYPSTGRMSNRLFCFFTKAHFLSNVWQPEPGLEPITIPRTELLRSIESPTPMLKHANCLACIGMAVIQRKI